MGTLTTFWRAEELPRRPRVIAFVVLVGVAISRSPYLLLHGRFYAEEGRLYFAHMRDGSIWFIARPVGYIYAFVNVSTWFAARISLERAPLVTAWLAFGVVAAIIWAALSWPSDLLPNAGSRVAAATLLVVSPMAVPAVWLNTTNVQVYFGVLALLLLFVGVTRMGRAGFVVAAILLAIAGLSGVYAAMLAPLFVLRAFRERSRRMILLASVISLCALAQVIVVTQHLGSGHLAENTGHFRGFAVTTRDVAGRQVTTFLFGNTIASGLQARAFSGFKLLAFGFCAVVVVAVLVAAVASVARRGVAVRLVLALLLIEVLVLFGTHGRLAAGRYVVVPIAILVLMAVHGTNSPNRFGAGLAAAACAVTFVAGIATFWTRQPATLRCVRCPEWQQEVRAWRAGTSEVLVIWPYDTGVRWVIRLPKDQTPAAAARPDGSDTAMRAPPDGGTSAAARPPMAAASS
ncbi:MAG TPA: hypothetical protein VL769_13960 [Acidimicrobiia bacterium]|nr:hypothetical protein [Acidimicrobiia bacterium]